MERTIQSGVPAPTSPLLRLYLLGRFEVVREDAPIPSHAWRRRRPADLLKLIALSPGRELTRDQTIDALWPDKDPASGANNLHRALYDLRQILGGRWVDIERGVIRMRPDVWVDVDAFERAVEAGGAERFQEAVALYRGDLAPEDGEVDWLHARRLQLRSRFVEAAHPLARAAAEAADVGAAVPLLRRLLDVDPAGEEAHRLLMQLLATAGRRAEALRQYDACEGALRAVGRAPAEETRALRDAIQRGELGPAPGAAALDGARRLARRLLGAAEPSPVRGRGAILLLLEALVERGSGMLVLLGERGVGKTRLAVEGARIAQARGAVVLGGVGSARPGEPFGLFVDLFGQEGRAGSHDPLAAPPSGRAPEAVLAELQDAVAAELRAAGEGRPLFLLLDDLHAADESSLQLLHALARRAAELRLMVVATCREEAIHAGTPLQTALAHLDAGRLARGVRLPRLGLAGTREQLTDLAGGPPPEALVQLVYRVTDGAPFLVEEALRAYAATGQVPQDPGAGLRARVGRLGPRAEALLGAAAVVGRHFEFDLVRPVSGLGGQETVKALEACLEAGLLDEDGTGYRFHHDLIREAVYQGLPGSRRAALHAAVADALEADVARPAPAEALARHRRLAGQEDRAVRHLVAAGHRAAARAGLREALTFYTEALELAPRAGLDGRARFELHEAAARVQLGLGELDAAVRAFGQAARLAGAEGFEADPARLARVHRLAAMAHAAAGDLPAARLALGEGLAAAGEAEPAEVAALHHLSAQLEWHAGAADRAEAAAAACGAAAAQAGDGELAARAEDLRALARGLRGEPLPPVTPAPAGPQDLTPEHPLDLHVVLWSHDLLGERGAPDLARAAGVLVERARQRQAPAAEAAGRLGEGIAALEAAQLEAAELALRAARQGFRAAGLALGEALAMERLASLLVMAGSLEEAGALLDEAVVVAERGTLRQHALTLLHAAEARHRLASGLPGAADVAMRAASEAAARHGGCTACDAAFRPEAVRTALARGRLDVAEAETSALEDLARRHGGRGFTALARQARARVLAAAGRPEDALVSLAQARAGFLASGQRYEAARAVRLEARLRGSLPEAWAALDVLVRIDADA
ncbi:MAG: BTAD domain-containing putative transcriptional regulator [Anaeromyxobacter sp.]